MTKSSRARDDGAPDTALDPTDSTADGGVSLSAIPGGGAVPSTSTIPGPGLDLETAQAAAVAAGAGPVGFPVDPAQVARPDELGRLDVPTAAPSGAPAGSVWGDATVDRQPASPYNEHDPGPRLAYVVTWAKAAVHVDPDAALERTVTGPDGDDATERYVKVTSQFGVRDAALEGQQVTLDRGEALPDEAVPGQGAFLVSLGAAVAVSVPPA